MTTSPPPLRAALHFGDIQLSLETLKKERHTELVVRVFNGSGRVVDFVKLSGRIRFSTPNTSDPAHAGELPEASIRADTARSVGQLKEWLLVLNQHVPAKEADKISDLLKSEPVHFDLSNLRIEVAPHDDPHAVEELLLWHGISYRRGLARGRIIAAQVNVTLGGAVGMS